LILVLQRSRAAQQWRFLAWSSRDSVVEQSIVEAHLLGARRVREGHVNRIDFIRAEGTDRGPIRPGVVFLLRFIVRH
jgi:hypothetical protein